MRTYFILYTVIVNCGDELFSGEESLHEFMELLKGEKAACRLSSVPGCFVEGRKADWEVKLAMLICH